MNSSVIHQVFEPSIANKLELDTVLNSFDLIECHKGDTLLSEGQYASEYYFVESGFLRAYAIDTRGNDITTGFYGQGQILWEVASLFLQTPTKENIEVLQSGKLWRITLSKFQELFDTIADFRDSGRTRLVQNHVKLKQRSLSMITDKAEVRYLTLMKEHPEIFQMSTLKHIATYLGITDSSLSRIRRDIIKK
ncbi:MAG: Crp/Fnr family transcriptional regulator [Bacteroidetes bacterium]|nr:MAG: Crp/Fnr family transcriptional regulator [Bacteroidota bacterium]